MSTLLMGQYSSDMSSFGKNMMRNIVHIKISDFDFRFWYFSKSERTLLKSLVKLYKRDFCGLFLRREIWKSLYSYKKSQFLFLFLL